MDQFDSRNSHNVNQRKESVAEVFARWEREWKIVQKTYGASDFDEECKNPEFVTLLANGVSVMKAYEIIHKDEIATRRVAYAKTKPKAKKHRGWIIGLVVILAIFCLNYQPIAKYLFNSHSVPQTSSSVTTPVVTPTVATPAVTPTNAPAPVSVYNGKQFIVSAYEGTCPFEVKADSNSNFYIYLDYQYAATNSTTARELTISARALAKRLNRPYENDIAFYLAKGQSYEIDVPVGVYKLYYATGDIFYGTEELFGSTSKFYSSDDLLNFYSTSEYYNGHTITLYSVTNGNFDTDNIPESKFPKR